jgi:hypothetical protein
VRLVTEKQYKVRVRRQTSKSHEFLSFAVGDLEQVDSPKGWMSPEGYSRYLEATLAEMHQREAAKERRSKGKRG